MKKKRILGVVLIVTMIMSMLSVPVACSSPAVGPGILSITVETLSDTSVKVQWATDQDALSRVEYGPTTSYGTNTPWSTTLAKEHSVTIAGLTPGATYHYKAVSKTPGDVVAKSADKTFNTTGLAVSGVTSTSVNNRGATITWTTDDPSSSQVEYGATTAYGMTTTVDSTAKTSHSVEITGLSKETTYHYRVKSASATADDVSGDKTFTTTEMILRVGKRSMPKSQNIWLHSTADREYLSMVYQRLVHFSQQTGNVYASPWGIAESWSVDETGMDWTFVLDPDAMWNDGEQVTASDVKWSWETAWSEAAKWSSIELLIDDIVVVDDLTVRFEFNDVYPDAVSFLAECYIAPEHVWADSADILAETNSNPVGSGPFMWTEYVSEDHNTFEPNPYWTRSENYIDEMIVTKYASTEAMILDFRRGNLDLTPDVQGKT